MLKIVTAGEMYKIDRETIEQVGIPEILLMENAGNAIIKSIERNFPEAHKIAIFTGKGNNGGDALVVARKLAIAGKSIEIFLTASPENFVGSALTNLKIVRNLDLPITEISELQAISEVELTKFHLIIDGIFGIGFRGQLNKVFSELVKRINATNVPTLAIDIPSGLNATTGIVENLSVSAEVTVTIGLPKRGLLFHPGSEMTGKLEIAKIDFPNELLTSEEIKVNWIERNDIKKLLPPRISNSHKGTYGRVFAIAGSVGMTGAAALLSQATLRSGAGLVTLALPKSLNSTLETKLTEVMTLPLPETKEGSIALRAKSKILEFADRTSSIIALGPGLSQNSETTELVQNIVRENSLPMVIDADALNSIAKSPSSLKNLSAETVLTPHIGEMARLTGKSINEISQNPIDVAQNFAVKYRTVLVLKSSPTVVADKNGEVWINSTGNPGMSTAGSGDLLTGLIAGFMAQNLSASNSAKLGVYLHGLAGDLAVKSIGMHSLMASDILNHIPKAILEIL